MCLVDDLFLYPEEVDVSSCPEIVGGAGWIVEYEQSQYYVFYLKEENWLRKEKSSLITNIEFCIIC